jgi:anion-transporting  ArsA/GET3 family ATPase
MLRRGNGLIAADAARQPLSMRARRGLAIVNPLGDRSLKNLLKKSSIVILLGTGGVGKTTVAAALGVAAAAEGLDTAVITVDPARRLRDALGLAHLGGKPTPISAKQLRAAGVASSRHLAAMMLDVKGAWDAVLERFVTDRASLKRILDNPFYQSLSAEFAGSEAFAALQQLYDLHNEKKFEFEIVDTPPAAHAFEFLEAPARMIRLLDSRAARWLFSPSLAAGRIAAKFASEAARFVVRELERFAGTNVLTTIADFFAAAAESVDAIVDRMHKTETLLRSPAVKFVMVTTAEPDRLRQAEDLVEEMERDGLKLAAIVVNRFLDERTWIEAAEAGADPLAHLREIGNLRSAAQSNSDGAGASALARFFEEYRDRTLGNIARVAAFRAALPAGITLAIAPELEIGVGDMAALGRVARYLTAGAGLLRPLETAATRLGARAHEGNAAPRAFTAS